MCQYRRVGTFNQIEYVICGRIGTFNDIEYVNCGRVGTFNEIEYAIYGQIAPFNDIEYVNYRWVGTFKMLFVDELVLLPTGPGSLVPYGLTNFLVNVTRNLCPNYPEMDLKQVKIPFW